MRDGRLSEKLAKVTLRNFNAKVLVGFERKFC
jgi:hypothetical protein